MKLVVFDLNLAHLLLELLVLETVLGGIALDRDGGRVGFGFGLDRLRRRGRSRHGGFLCCRCCCGSELRRSKEGSEVDGRDGTIGECSQNGSVA